MLSSRRLQIVWLLVLVFFWGLKTNWLAAKSSALLFPHLPSKVLFTPLQPLGTSSPAPALSEVTVRWFRDCISGYLRIRGWNSLCPVNLKTSNLFKGILICSFLGHYLPAAAYSVPCLHWRLCPLEVSQRHSQLSLIIYFCLLWGLSLGQPPGFNSAVSYGCVASELRRNWRLGKQP